MVSWIPYKSKGGHVTARKKWRGFGNFVPEFFIDAGTHDVKISLLVHNFI
jgi:hypothetical protein